MEKGTVYYFAQAGIERSKKCLTIEEAKEEAFFMAQRHNPKIYIKEAVVGTKGFKVLELLQAGFK